MGADNETIFDIARTIDEGKVENQETEREWGN